MTENYSLSEQETNINYDRLEGMAVVYTRLPAKSRKSIPLSFSTSYFLPTLFLILQEVYCKSY